jgi:hypothetical protein
VVLKWIQTRKEKADIEWDVRSLWKIKNVGHPEQARSETGSIVAATVVPVVLESGKSRTEQTVYVIVTYQAVQDLKFVNGRDPDLAALAETYVTSRLLRQGKSEWDPKFISQLEINAGLALDIHRTLAKTA